MSSEIVLTLLLIAAMIIGAILPWALTAYFNRRQRRQNILSTLLSFRDIDIAAESETWRQVLNQIPLEFNKNNKIKEKYFRFSQHCNTERNNDEWLSKFNDLLDALLSEIATVSNYQFSGPELAQISRLPDYQRQGYVRKPMIEQATIETLDQLSPILKSISDAINSDKEYSIKVTIVSDENDNDHPNKNNNQTRQH